MYGFIFKFFAVAVALLVAFYSAANAFRKARALDAKIEEYKREQEDRKRRGLTQDPYSELADLYAQRDQPVKPKRETRP